MSTERVRTHRLELVPLPVRTAAALPGGRDEVSAALGLHLPEEWPDPNLLGVLRRHAGAPEGFEHYGVWVMIELETRSVVGDIGFHGPPDETGTVEIGYSVIPGRRGRGYAAEAAGAIVEWALAQTDVRTVVAGCDPHNLPSIATLERVGFRRTGDAGGEIRWRFG